MTIKFSLRALRDYLQGGFERGLAFQPEYTGKQLVETRREGGCFVQMDHNGAPVLKDSFVEHMDSTTYDLSIPAERVKCIIESLRVETRQSYADEKRQYLYATLAWLAHDNKRGVTQEAFAERMGVTDRTVRNWIAESLQYISNALNGNEEKIAFVLISPVYHPQRVA